METGSGGNSHGCLLNQLGGVEDSICQPTLELSGESPGYGKGVPSQTGGDNPCADITDMVPPTVSNGNRGTTAITRPTAPNTTNAQRQPTRHNTTSSRMDYLRSRFSKNLSKESSDLLLASWREKSSKTYDSLFGKWVSWCSERNSDPVSNDISEVANFLTELFHHGYQYRSLNAYRSAISLAHDKVDGLDVGQHPLISGLLKGAFNSRPPQPRYAVTWDVSIVTSYLDNLGSNEEMSLTDLTHKTAMLMALVRPCRSAELAHLDIRHKQYSPEGVTFMPTKLAKQSRPGKERASFFFHTTPNYASYKPLKH